MCGIWKTPSKISEELTFEEIKTIFKDLKSYGIKHVFLQGGEPLLRTDIVQIVEVMLELKLNPSIITNGLLLKEDISQRLAKLKCNVGISLDTLDQNKYFKIRGVDGLKIVLGNIERISHIKSRKGSWNITSTISKINYGEAKDLYLFAKQKGFDYQAFPYNYSLCHSSALDDDLAYDKEPEKIIDSFKVLSKLAEEDGLIFNKLLYDEAIKYLEGDYCVPCDAMKNSILINQAGMVSQCLEFKPSLNLKNVRIKEALSKLDYSKVQNCYMKTPCFYGCTRAAGLFKRKSPEIFLYSLLHPRAAFNYVKSYF